MYRIDTHLYLCIVHTLANSTNIIYRMMILDSIHTTLPLIFTDIFHIDKNSVHSGDLSYLCHHRLIGYVH